MPHRSALLRVLAPGLALPLLLSACVAGAPEPADEVGAGAGRGTDDPGTGDGHGEVAGAAEVAEAPVGLTTADAAGVVRHLDLADETVEELARLGPVQDLATDGRYLFAPQAGGVAVLDSGVWTWDHVDHQHFYRGDPREVGTVAGGGPVTVATSEASHVGGTGLFFSGTGEAVLLDNAALADGELDERFRLEVDPHDGLVVPVGDAALVTRPAPGETGRADELVAVDADGEPLAGAAYACPEAAGTITTRVGAVVGCADGALLAVAGEDGPTVERIPYPQGARAPAVTELSGRKGRPTVAGLADRDRVWLLDTRERSWRLLRSPVPLEAVGAVDDAEQHVVGLTTRGEVAVLDGASGALLATTPPLARASVREGTGRPTLVLDQQRAYLSAPVEGRLVEVDFADDARVSRTFETAGTPLFTAGTGR